MSAMNSASIRVNESRSSAGPRASPTVFVVDDDESVRESLELLISSAGWKPRALRVGAGIPLSPTPP